ncbi:MAG: T9SS type A sorting domain-containing protein [Ignavibacteriaceae bacterium]|nr:T9SS type A sorting domain-containing protein [Ignavibacteriaceae bacterium]
MKKTVLLLASVLILLPALFLIRNTEYKKPAEAKFIPSEWFHYQRAYPGTEIPHERYLKAMQDKEKMVREADRISTVEWLPAGPYNIGGRITGLAVDPANINTIYIGAAAGGLFKSTDGGNTWIPKTDFFPSLSVGALEIDPNNPSVLYLGTGEANISTDSYAGFGMLKSTDAGETWFLSGLENSRHIGEIKVHPLNSNLVYAAVSGGLYSKGPDRGLYKSTDAGASWNKVLFVNDSTSAIDVELDPTDPNRIYCAMWERLRGPTFRKAAGASSSIYLSTDGGTTWTNQLTGLPVNNNTIGRISIAVAPSDPNIVYALYKTSNSANGTINVFYGFYKSTNKGASWTRMPNGILPGEFSNFGWYFGEIEVYPDDPNKIILGEIDLLRSTDGGTSWINITNSYSGTFEQQHPDQHPFWINPQNTNVIYVGNDGGFFISTDGGNIWNKKYDLPISQFYAATIDYLNPDRLYGGTQDNGTMRTWTGGLSDWDFIYGGDGFHTQVDYTNSNIIYAEYQFGGLGRSTDGGSNFSSITSGLDLTRTNWSSPYIIDPAEPTILYFGSYKLFKTTNRGNSWTAISPDLTRGPNGRLGTITTISAELIPSTQTRVIYAGTDDAKVSVSTNSGSTWTDVTGNLPNRYITDVVADRRNPAVAYVTLSGYNLDNTNPHVFRTTDYGASWTDISGNLPDIPVNSIQVDFSSDSLLIVGTDAGVFYTKNLGTTWSVAGTGLPNSPVFDLILHQPTKKLVAATHGRSMYMADISPLLGIEDGESSIKSYRLYQNYPNPFNPSTAIRLDLVKGGETSIRVYDVAGSEVALLHNGYLKAGSHSFTFSGASLNSGVYFCRLISGGRESVIKMVLLK